MTRQHKRRQKPVSAQGSNSASNKLQSTKKRGWPLDFALAIAGLALVVSIAQLLVTAPLFSQRLFGPKLIVTVNKVSSDAIAVTGGFLVQNLGSTVATHVEIGIVTFPDSEIHVFPAGAHAITGNDESQALFLNRTLRFERLLPNERFSVLITELPRPSEETKAANRLAKSMHLKPLPEVIFARSAEGMGEIVESPNEPIVTRIIATD